ncbi:MAG: trigger factor [Candidatus Magasanikbacteria bacterium]|nr:trigger factor [Candidatus Magasanikbacteria bacterium]
MNYDKKLDKAQAILTFTITPAEYQKDLESAALRLSERAAIKGFRPGKAPYNIVKQQLGEVKILEEAAEHIVQRTYFAAVKEEKLQTIGMPQVSIKKLAPGNDLVYEATVALLPSVMVADISKIKVERAAKKVDDKEVGETLENLRKMQPKELTKAGPAAKEDKVTIDMDMFIDNIPVEGGQAKNHHVYLNEPHYIAGLAEQLVGLKKNDTKEFTLPFPKDHYQKHLAGKNVDFKIKVNEVFELQYADLDDAFAKQLGQESLEKLKELLLANLSAESEKKEDQRAEIAILDQLIEKSTFGELPSILIDSEKRKMFYELKHDLDQRGITIEQYLKDIKKTEEEIFKDFTEQATKRAKAALVSRQIALDNKITVDKADLDKEIETIKKTYAGEKNVEENLRRTEVLDTIAATIQNRKVLEWLKGKLFPQ